MHFSEFHHVPRGYWNCTLSYSPLFGRSATNKNRHGLDDKRKKTLRRLQLTELCPFLNSQAKNFWHLEATIEPTYFLPHGQASICSLGICCQACLDQSFLRHSKWPTSLDRIARKMHSIAISTVLQSKWRNMKIVVGLEEQANACNGYGTDLSISLLEYSLIQVWRLCSDFSKKESLLSALQELLAWPTISPGFQRASLLRIVQHGSRLDWRHSWWEAEKGRAPVAFDLRIWTEDMAWWSKVWYDSSMYSEGSERGLL